MDMRSRTLEPMRPGESITSNKTGAVLGTFAKDDDMQAVYQKMGDALRSSGRDIVYSLCQSGRADVWKWGPQAGGNFGAPPATSATDGNRCRK